MSLIDEVIGALEDEGRDSGSTRPEGYYPMAGYIIADLNGRGIDLELAYQWRRAEKALPEGWWFECYISGVLAGDINPHTGYPVTSPTHRYVAVSQPTWYPLCDDSDEAPIEVRGEADSPAAALSALVDALEART